MPSIDITFKKFQVGPGSPLTFFLGPCVIESRDSIFRHAEIIKGIAEKTKANVVFKASYDKANRTSAGNFRGPGIEEGLSLMSEIRAEFDMPIISDCHTVQELEIAKDVLDVVQIPAFLCRQTDLLVAAGKTQKPVLIKKAQFLHPDDMKHVIEKIRFENPTAKVMQCERGSCFGYRSLVVDFSGISRMKAFGTPVVFDATHSVQSMGGADGKSGGNRQFVVPLARAAVASGVDAIFMESHIDPESARSDGPNMLPLSQLERVVTELSAMRALISTFSE